MARSKCGACGELGAFELAEPFQIKGTDKKYNFIQCAKCGAVVGAVEGWHLSTALSRIMDKMGISGG